MLGLGGLRSSLSPKSGCAFGRMYVPGMKAPIMLDAARCPGAFCDRAPGVRLAMRAPDCHTSL